MLATALAPLDAPRFATALPGPRAWLRARPGLQGALVAPGGSRHRLPHRRGGLYVLLYHDVPPAQERHLAEHLDALLDRGGFVSWGAALDALAGPAPLEVPVFCLTFDDGHKEWAHSVLPLLQERNIPACFFVTTERVAGGASSSRLTWSDCATLVDAGMEIGSHTVTHRRLTELSCAQARHEVTASKKELEQRLGVPVLDFSVPYGLPGSDFTDRELDLVAEAGYRSSATALPGRNLAGQAPYQVRRCGLNAAWPLLAVKQRVHE